MKPKPDATRLVCVPLALGVCLLAAEAGCSRKVGDGCTLSTDCDPTGSRVCDLSQPGGYCTIDGCDDKSCPDESVCIRTFPQQYLTKPCDPLCEDSPCANGAAGCACAGAATDDCTTDEICIDSGLCARQAFERRYCAKSCGDNGDCRGSYECRASGTRGNFALVQGNGAAVRFCARQLE
jgi:hypothetical protein